MIGSSDVDRIRWEGEVASSVGCQVRLLTTVWWQFEIMVEGLLERRSNMTRHLLGRVGGW